MPATRVPTIDWSKPISRGIVFCVVGDWPVDLATGNKAVYGGGRRSGSTRWGPAWESTVTDGSQYQVFPDRLLVNRITTKHSIFYWYDIDTVQDDGSLFTVPHDGTFNEPLQNLAFDMDDPGDECLCRFTVAGPTRTNYNPGGGYWVTGQHDYLWTRNAATQTVYKDGAQFGTTSGGNAGAVLFSGSSTEIILNRYSTANAGNSPDGRRLACVVWDRDLTAGEALQLHADPLAFLRGRGKPEPWFVVVPAGGTDASPAPSAVAVTKTVQSPTVTATANPSPSAVAATKTVQTPTVTASANPAPSAVAATVTVNAPSVTTGADANPTPSAVTVTATVNAPTVTATANPAPSAVAVTATVPTPSVTTGADAFISTSTVTAAATVQSPTVTATANPSPSAVAVTKTVQSPTVTAAVSITVTTVAGVAAIQSPTITATASIAASVVAALATVRGPHVNVPNVFAVGGRSTTALAVQTSTTTLTVQSDSETVAVQSNTHSTLP